MKQPAEVIRFSQQALANIITVREGMGRVAGHVNRALGSFHKGVGNPFLLSDEAARQVLEVERALERVRVALDDARLQLTKDQDYYLARVREATPLAQAEQAAK